MAGLFFSAAYAAANEQELPASLAADF